MFMYIQRYREPTTPLEDPHLPFLGAQEDVRRVESPILQDCAAQRVKG
jgi:hypothetical protein